MISQHALALVLAAAALVLPARAETKHEPPALTTNGNALLADYTKMLDSLKSQVLATLPKIDPAKSDAFLAARAEWNALNHPGDDAPPEVRKSFVDACETSEAKALAAARTILADLDPFLASDALDGPLMKIAILTQATPRGLAEFAQQGTEEKELLDSLFADEPLMRQILEAGGANGGEYGEAMQVYSAIQKASSRARETNTIFQRLALGTAIHQPLLPGKQPGGVYFIQHRSESNNDPVKRYLHYEKAYLDGELDPAFKDMNTWHCRFITDDMHSDEDLTWMRQMMRNYRPDHISYQDYKWRYVRLVKDDMPYCSTTHDPSLGSRAQEALALGGICGRRAFIGRLTLRAFGIPTRASTQSGHAALSHWTPDGWTICFGAWWSVAWCGPQGGLDFLLESQAREFPDQFTKVLRAQWIADALGEQDVSIRHFGKDGGLWESLAFYKKQAIVKDAEIEALELTGGMKLGESDELIGDETAAEVEVPEEFKNITTATDGTLTIPAVACYSPRGPSDRVLLMKSWDEGMQLHYGRLGQRPELVKYRIEVPAAGDYELSALVATVSNKQDMLVRINREEPVSCQLPYTKGDWMKSETLKITLEEGRNTLSITARAPNRGISIKHFELKPLK